MHAVGETASLLALSHHPYCVSKHLPKGRGGCSRITEASPRWLGVMRSFGGLGQDATDAEVEDKFLPALKVISRWRGRHSAAPPSSLWQASQ